MKKTKKKNSSPAALLGAIGGKSTSDAKKKAVRKNGKKGGRPRIIRETFGSGSFVENMDEGWKKSRPPK